MPTHPLGELRCDSGPLLPAQVLGHLDTLEVEAEALPSTRTCLSGGRAAGYRVRDLGPNTHLLYLYCTFTTLQIFLKNVPGVGAQATRSHGSPRKLSCTLGRLPGGTWH